MPDLTCHIVTFNCGRNLVNVDYFASSLYSSFQPNALPPDLIVLALQELAPLGFSFLGGSLLEPYFRHLRDAVSRATAWRFAAEADWEDVTSSHLGMTGIMVFARREVKQQIHSIEEAGTGVGVKDMGNKGAVGVRIGLGEEETTVTFIAAHLAPSEDAWPRRNADWKAICETLVFEPAVPYDSASASASRTPSLETEAQPLLRRSLEGSARPHGIFSPPSYVFFAGDLNYRTADKPPAPGAFASWPQPDSDLEAFFATDQLNRERDAQRTVHHLSEAPVKFPPTYKYSSKAQHLVVDYARLADTSNNASTLSSPPTIPDAKLARLATSHPEEAYLWAKHRVPSWCDRILYSSSASVQVHAYTALPVQPTSDHRPVVLSCSVPRRPLSKTESVATPPFAISPTWRARRDVARRYEVVVGVGAYLGFTSQGQTVLVGAVLAVLVGSVILSYAF